MCVNAFTKERVKELGSRIRNELNSFVAIWGNHNNKCTCYLLLQASWSNVEQLLLKLSENLGAVTNPTVKEKLEECVLLVKR